MPPLFTSDGASYDGMDIETVIRLRSELGKVTNFVDESSYFAIIEAQRIQPSPVDSNKEKVDWQAAKTKGTTEAVAFLAAKLGLE